ncbi:curli-like amyloid fiber formation chaperone CsgH [Devosia sp. 2618]|uniref:curli-like amyloid fiber formation chaperone CsgH n=1 Tax=Devosia sp. 2618 TaxID=3156454 RepID=UPI003393FFC1
MTTSIKTISAIGLLGFGLAAIVATTSLANAGAPSDTCGYVTSTQNGMLVIEGAVLSAVPLQGSYTFRLQSSSGGGSSNISQGGNFTAIANQQTALGKVMINAGSNYKVDFSVSANGQAFDCNQEVANLR